jgi:nitrite reductase/ring-hydroxylating ferredoxin subunit
LTLPPFPKGWFALCFSDELAPGTLRSGTYFGRELIIYRTEGGQPVVMDAYCPHMGAHLGRGGCVKGENVVCPFHAFAFDPEGRCVETPYGKRLPKATATTLPVVDRNGIILAWFHPEGTPPEWTIPELPPGPFGPLKTKTWPPLRSHPQETTENSVDFGHLSVVHGYRDVTILRELETDGPYLNARYAMTRDHFIPGLSAVRAEFEVHVYGLGYSFVETYVEQQGLRGRHFVLPTPLDGTHIELRAAVAIDLPDPGRMAKPLGLMPRRAAQELVSEVVIRAYAGDISQDFEIWENKRYVQPPSLAEGDGPVGPYRRWCRQFYPAPDAHTATPQTTAPASA